MELPARKHNRLANYDYSMPGAYFITVCTEKRKLFFWENVGAIIGRPYAFDSNTADERRGNETGWQEYLAEKFSRPYYS